MARTDILFPVGRIVSGNLYKANTQDAEGRPLVFKHGAQAGQARQDFYFALAIPKGTESHWSQTEWGAKIWASGHAFMPAAGNMPVFAWKVQDGDSQIPNRKGKKPCDREGFKGNWVVSLSSSYAPRIYNRDGTQVITEVDAVKPGYYVQVYGNVDSNGSQQQPGVYLNHSMVSLQGYGPEIVMGPDAAAVGFGAAALPAGATATPVGGFSPAPLATPPAMPQVPPVMAAPAASVATVAIVPNPAILQVPPVPAAAPVAAPRLMTPAATNSYEEYIAAGWTDSLLIQHGLMAA